MKTPKMYLASISDLCSACLSSKASAPDTFYKKNPDYQKKVSKKKKSAQLTQSRKKYEYLFFLQFPY
jgi:hypothetical protein